MKFIAIIPARYASTRFPGKPLAMLGDKPMIQHVYERVKPCVDEVVVATDDERILNAVSAFGGRAVMTSTSHRSGTDRLAEAAAIIGASDTDVIINVQGDEPFIHPDQIAAIKSCFDNAATEIATLGRPFDPARGFDALADPNLVKVVISEDKSYALMFSRAVIPFVRGKETGEWLSSTDYYTHIGIYAYRFCVLREITALPPSQLEVAESLEQLRWLQNGYRIRIALSSHPTIGIDTPADLAEAEKLLSKL